MSKPRSVIRISAKVHKEITSKNPDNFTNGIKCFGLGENTKGIVDVILPLKSGCSGCEHMPNLTRKTLTKAMIDFTKKRRKFVGLVRICNQEYLDDGDRGDGLEELYNMNPNAFIISYNREEFKVETYERELTYTVVK
jgi:hypothetical protein